MAQGRLELDAEEARTVYQAIVIAHDALREGLQTAEVRAAFTPEQLAQHEELCFKFADLLERFRGYE